MLDIIRYIVTNTIFLTYLGAVFGHILSLYSNEFKGAIPFLERAFPGKSATFYFRLDFLILPIIGCFLAFVLLDPSNLKSSIFAGLSWSGTLTGLLKRSSSPTNLS